MNWASTATQEKAATLGRSHSGRGNPWPAGIHNSVRERAVSPPGPAPPDRHPGEAPAGRLYEGQPCHLSARTGAKSTFPAEIGRVVATS